jgi:hypothetical protein
MSASATLLLPGLDLDDAPAPPRPGTLSRKDPPPASPFLRTRRVGQRLQRVLPIVEALPDVPDYHAARGGRCLVQQDACEAEECRHHLGGLREFHGRVYGCALAVADAYPQGLAPVYVARLLGLPEGDVQRTEHRGLAAALREHQRIEAEDDED